MRSVLSFLLNKARINYRNLPQSILLQCTNLEFPCEDLSLFYAIPAPAASTSEAPPGTWRRSKWRPLRPARRAGKGGAMRHGRQPPAAQRPQPAAGTSVRLGSPLARLEAARGGRASPRVVRGVRLLRPRCARGQLSGSEERSGSATLPQRPLVAWWVLRSSV